MPALALAIAASVAAGVWAQRRFGDGALTLTRRLLDAMLYVALPLISFFVVARAELTAAAGAGLVLAYVALAVTGLLAWVIATRVLHLAPRSAAMLVIAAIMANTGYFGAPVVATLLGHDELGAAITFDALVASPVFYVAAFLIAAMLTTRGQPPAARLRTYLLRNPPLIAVAAALVAPDALAPDVLVDVARVGIIAIAPIGFFVVGVRLAAERIGFPPPLGAPVAVVVALRIVVAPLLLLGLATLAGGVPDAYLLQAAMPVGINTLVVAHAYDLDAGLAAAALAWSTALTLAAALVAAALDLTWDDRAVPLPELVREHPLVEQILDEHSDRARGDDVAWAGYTGHVYRVLNFARALTPQTPDRDDKLAIAAPSTTSRRSCRWTTSRRRSARRTTGCAPPAARHGARSWRSSSPSIIARRPTAAPTRRSPRRFAKPTSSTSARGSSTRGSRARTCARCAGPSTSGRSSPASYRWRSCATSCATRWTRCRTCAPRERSTGPVTRAPRADARASARRPAAHGPRARMSTKPRPRDRGARGRCVG